MTALFSYLLGLRFIVWGYFSICGGNIPEVWRSQGEDAAYKKGRVLTPAASALVGLIRNTLQKQVNDLYHLSYVYSTLP
jgi:hypothetical protein